MTSYAKIDTWATPSGSVNSPIVQVVQFNDGGTTWSQAIADGNTYYTVPYFQATITLKYPNSKVLVMMDMHMGTGYWEVQGRMTRNGTDICLGVPRGFRSACSFNVIGYNYNGSATYSQYDWYTHSAKYLDTPQVAMNSTNTYTYGLRLNGYSTQTIYFNRPGYNNFDSDYWSSPISTITLLEIAQ
jgi:hypothetical protein